MCVFSNNVRTIWLYWNGIQSPRSNRIGVSASIIQTPPWDLMYLLRHHLHGQKKKPSWESKWNITRGNNNLLTLVWNQGVGIGTDHFMFRTGAMRACLSSATPPPLPSHSKPWQIAVEEITHKGKNTRIILESYRDGLQHWYLILHNGLLFCPPPLLLQTRYSLSDGITRKGENSYSLGVIKRL